MLAKDVQLTNSQYLFYKSNYVFTIRSCIVKMFTAVLLYSTRFAVNADPNNKTLEKA